MDRVYRLPERPFPLISHLRQIPGCHDLRVNHNAAETLARIGSKLNPKTKVGDLSFVDRQMVEIARAIRVGDGQTTSPVVILDEPFTLGIAIGLPLVLVGSYFASRKVNR